MQGRIKYFVILFSTFLVGALLFGAMNTKTSSPEEVYRHLSVFTEVLSRIKSDYVEEPDMKLVTQGAVNGLLESLDPYASYLSADQYKQYQANKTAKKADVGLILAKKYGYISVVDAIPGSPADKQGLGTGDMIETIAGVSTRDMPLAYAEIMLQGEQGTSVEISVLRFRHPEPQKVGLVRAPIVYPQVVSKMLDGNVGMVKVESMEAGKLKAITSALSALDKQGAQKLVLDLRNSAVGAPEDGVTLANLFVDKGLLGYTMGQKSPQQNFEADAQKQIFKKPLVVITNRGTAGPAEIAAAALQDRNRASVVGERTYGDAAVRKAIGMDDGGAVILSVAKYYSPSGKAIQDTGVTPTVAQIEQDATTEEEDENNPQLKEEAPKKPSEDLLLKKALETLNGGGTQAASGSAAPQTKPGNQTPGLGPLNIPKP